MQRAKPKIPAERIPGIHHWIAYKVPSKGHPSQPISALPCPLSPVSDSPSPPPIQIILLIISVSRESTSRRTFASTYIRHDTIRYDTIRCPQHTLVVSTWGSTCALAESYHATGFTTQMQRGSLAPGPFNPLARITPPFSPCHAQPRPRRQPYRQRPSVHPSVRLLMSTTWTHRRRHRRRHSQNRSKALSRRVRYRSRVRYSVFKTSGPKTITA